VEKEKFISLALSYLGFPSVKYKNPDLGCSENGFDCSGFVKFLLLQAQYPDIVPRHSNEQFDTLGIFVHIEFCCAGDLVFFSKKGIVPTHVGIMISHNEYIHAPGRTGMVVEVNKLDQKIIKFRGMNPQIYFSNPVGFKRLTVSSGRYRKKFLY